MWNSLASKLDDIANLIVQIAIMFGFFEDIGNGVGFNSTGRPGEVGDVLFVHQSRNRIPVLGKHSCMLNTSAHELTFVRHA